MAELLLGEIGEAAKASPAPVDIYVVAPASYRGREESLAEVFLGQGHEMVLERRAIRPQSLLLAQALYLGLDVPHVLSQRSAAGIGGERDCVFQPALHPPDLGLRLVRIVFDGGGHPAGLVDRLRQESGIGEIGGDLVEDLPFDEGGVHPLAVQPRPVGVAARVPMPLLAVGGEEDARENELLRLANLYSTGFRVRDVNQGEHALGVFAADERLVRGLLAHAPLLAGAPHHALARVFARGLHLLPLVPERVPGVGEGVSFDRDQAGGRFAELQLPRGQVTGRAGGSGLEERFDLGGGARVDHEGRLMHGDAAPHAAGFLAPQLVADRSAAASSEALGDVGGEPRAAFLGGEARVQPVEGAHDGEHGLAECARAVNRHLGILYGDAVLLALVGDEEADHRVAGDAARVECEDRLPRPDGVLQRKEHVAQTGAARLVERAADLHVAVLVGDGKPFRCGERLELGALGGKTDFGAVLGTAAVDGGGWHRFDSVPPIRGLKGKCLTGRGGGVYRVDNLWTQLYSSPSHSSHLRSER